MIRRVEINYENGNTRILELGDHDPEADSRIVRFDASEEEDPPCWHGVEDCDSCTQKCEDELRKRQGLPREGEPGFEASPKPNAY